MSNLLVGSGCDQARERAADPERSQPFTPLPHQLAADAQALARLASCGRTARACARASCRRTAVPGGRQRFAAALPRRVGARAPQPAARPGAGHDDANDPAAGRRRLRGVLRQPLAGHGPGDHFADVADRHAAAIVERFGGPVPMIGHSTGGPAAAAARRPPGRGHPSRGGERRVRPWSGRQAGATGADAGGRADRPLLRRGHRVRDARVLPPTGRSPAGRAARGAGCPPDPGRQPGRRRHHAPSGGRVRRSNRLPQIPTETLVAYGARRDYFWPLEMVAETADRMPRARLVLYADRGHALPTAREFVRDVVAFLHEGTAA